MAMVKEWASGKSGICDRNLCGFMDEKIINVIYRFLCVFLAAVIPYFSSLKMSTSFLRV